MAIASYLFRRDGRYYVQIRFSKPLALLMGRPLYRSSLETASYSVAKSRLTQMLLWLQPMNEFTTTTTDDMDSSEQRRIGKEKFEARDKGARDERYPVRGMTTETFETLRAQIEEYLDDAWPISEDRLVARKKFREYVNQAIKILDRYEQWKVGDVDMDLYRALTEFSKQNGEADLYYKTLQDVSRHGRARTEERQNALLTMTPRSFRRTNPDRPKVSLPRKKPMAEQTQANPIPEPMPSDGTPTQPTKAEGKRLRASEALAEYVLYKTRGKYSLDLLAGDTLVLQFMIDEFDDPIIWDLSAANLDRLEKMLPEIPNRKGVPKDHIGSLSLRYRYARHNGWDGLDRLTGARIQKVYHSSLSKFFTWAMQAGHFPGPKPVFRHVSVKNLVSLPRDSFSHEEVVKIISMPLFTGCASRSRIWKPGPFLVQSELYWGYILLLLTGVRTGELGQLRISDFEERDGIVYLDLRGFDPKEGRVSFEELRKFKTKHSERIIPLHPLIIDLGFLDRLEALKKVGCDVAFPEWQPYPKPSGEMRWGQPISKSWQYLKRLISIDRQNVTLYSTRHFFADLVDNSDVSDRARKRLMGHTQGSDAASGYGTKQRLTARDLAEFGNATNPTVDKMVEILLEAKQRVDSGELELLTPWLNRSSWSSYYQDLFFSDVGRPTIG